MNFFISVGKWMLAIACLFIGHFLEFFGEAVEISARFIKQAVNVLKAWVARV